MNKFIVINDFVNNNLPTDKIAKKYRLPKGLIKEILITNLGKEKYLRLAHSIGGKIIARKLKNPNYKKLYSNNLSKMISDAIKQKMRSSGFKERWIEKSKRASKEGRKKINRLLETDLKFRAKWVENCSRGGTKSFKLNLGVFDKSNMEARKEGSMRGLKNTKRKLIGPNDEKMYNNFEKYIANRILSNDLTYTYERVFIDENSNGFISCDFEIKINGKLLLIEATCWDKYKDKALQINKKFQKLNNQLKNFEFILVAPTKRQSEKYSEFLDKEIRCYSSYEFEDKLKSIARGGFEPPASGL